MGKLSCRPCVCLRARDLNEIITHSSDDLNREALIIDNSPHTGPTKVKDAQKNQFDLLLLIIKLQRGFRAYRNRKKKNNETTSGTSNEPVKIKTVMVDIEDFNGRYIIIPSKEVFQKPLVNYSQTSYRKINIAVGVSYGDNMKEVRKLLYDTIKKVEGVGTTPADVRIDFDGFGDSSINFVVGFFITKSDQKSYKTIEAEAATAIKEAFDANDIMIPFPIRTLDFGIRGGEKLNEQLSLNKQNGQSKTENQSKK